MSIKEEKPDLVWREFDELKPHPMNSNRHPSEQVDSMASMLERLGDGKIQISVQKSTDYIMTGHGLIESMKQEGHTGAWVIEKNYDDATALAWMEADNQYQKLSVIDQPTQLANLVELKRMDVELEPLGFELKAIDTLKREVDNRVTEEDDPPDVSEEPPITQMGDLWHLGRHRVLAGDSTRAEDVGRVMDGEKADMVFTDPPYGVGYDGGATEREKLEGDHNTDLYMPTCQMAFDYSHEKAALYLWHAGVKGIAAAAAAAAAAAGYEIRCELIWNKNQAQYGAFSAQYKQKHEPCYYCFKLGKVVNWYGTTREITVWDIDRASINDFHPTQKPIALSAKAMQNSSRVNDVVLDLYLGSGATLIAADQLDRICYGLEISPAYCDVICRRYINHVGSSDGVFVERDGERASWEQAQRKEVAAHIC